MRNPSSPQNKSKNAICICFCIVTVFFVFTQLWGFCKKDSAVKTGGHYVFVFVFFVFCICKKDSAMKTGGEHYATSTSACFQAVYMHSGKKLRFFLHFFLVLLRFVQHYLWYQNGIKNNHIFRGSTNKHRMVYLVLLEALRYGASNRRWQESNAKKNCITSVAGSQNCGREDNN